MNKNVIRALVAAGSVVLLALLAPVIWAAASAGVGLAVIGIIGAVLFGAIQMVPYLGQKIENTVLKLRKNEAKSNPIEQLQNYMREKALRVEQFKSAVSSIGAQIKTLKDLVNQRKRENPRYDATERLAAITEMERAHEVMKQKYVNAEKALEELKIAIKDKEFEWKFAEAGNAALKSINAASGEELLKSMLADEAFSSVSENFNKVFAELETEAQHLSSTNQLEFNSGMVLDISGIDLTQKVNA